MSEAHSLEQPDAICRIRSKWRGAEPTSMTVIEYHGDGDPAFGGAADDRPLGPEGLILTRGEQLQGIKPRVFATLEAAHDAAKQVKNRRPNSILGVATSWR